MIHGGYWTIELKDGKTANAKLLERYKGFLGYMESNHARIFNEACRSVHLVADDVAEKIAAMKTQKNLDIAQFKMQPTNDSEARMRVLWGDNLEEHFYPNYHCELYDDQIKAAIKLCTEPTLLSRVFSAVAVGRPLSYKVTDPVKDGARPIMCEYMWIGSSGGNIFERNILS